MKRCIKAHTVASFGEIPEGSLWDDDSPYVKQAKNFVAVDESDEPTEES
jgi:hypothetical protein